MSHKQMAKLDTPLEGIAYFPNNGSVQFHQCNINSCTVVTFNLSNLPPNKKMACHIHEYGDERNGCMSLGGHWNPGNTEHGSIFIDIMESHAGDLLNNIKSDSNGNFNSIYHDPRINLCGNVRDSIFGRSVVIHDGIDDLGLGNNKESKITGNAGGRMLCAIIGHKEK